MRALVLPANCDRILVRPWADPILDEVGHDPRSHYVERFWLGTLGPSATWFVRYVADRFDLAPGEFTLDFEACAAAIGIGGTGGGAGKGAEARGAGAGAGGGSRRRTGGLPRIIARCCSFELARVVNHGVVEIRRKIAPLSRRQLNRLSDSLRAEHERWMADAPDPSLNAVLALRARRMALTLLQMGEDTERAEIQLQRWRFPTQLAGDAIGWAAEQCRDRPTAAAL